MDLEKFVRILPEVGAELIAKAKRVDALRLEAQLLEQEVWGTVNAQWTSRERAKAKIDAIFPREG